MSASTDQLAEALRISAKETERLRQLNRSLREAASEPIAIVGMSCRYPGGIVSPADLWDLVAAGRDAISEFPRDRDWDVEQIFDPDPESQGTSYVRDGGFVSSATEFDAGFFGIGPREALAMDPQGRLLLEGAWAALEDAGIDPEHLRGSEAGIFAGLMYHDYGWGYRPTAEHLGHFTAGGGGSIVSGRVAYALGLEGPAISVDTACSSSLVSIHLAAQALRRGECSLALAGGVTVLSTPSIFIYFSHQRGLAPDGRCKSFADAADGTGVSEGIGLVVLERLSDAQRNGHRVLATIRGSAVNQDGASNGLTAPNGPAQERVIRQALASAGLAPADVDAVEAHGTGTTLGDPIEAGALLATYGQERQAPLRLGSIKSNIGHSQAAAGVAGVIKMTMALGAGVLPKTLHLDRPSTQVDWDAGSIELLGESIEWTTDGRPRRAAVSSFGVSGTNAHLILEQAPAAPAPSSAEGSSQVEPPFAGPFLFPLSAKSEPALEAQASHLGAWLERDPEAELADIAHSLVATRAKLDRRAVAVASGREELLEALDALASGEEADGVVRGRASAAESPAFVFPGQGSQWPRMGAALAASSAVFDRQLDRCEEALSPFIDWSVRDVLRGAADAPSIELIDVVQPALFAVMVSLAELWRACGVRPSAVAGHSQGEIAAACVAGGLTLEDGARISALRSQLIARNAGRGTMASVAASAEEVERRISPWEGRIEVAARNGPRVTILSGELEALGELLPQLEDDGVWARKLPIGVMASHSAMVEPLKDELLELLAPIEPRQGEIPFHSTVTGGLLDTRELDAEYWYRNMRLPVRFEEVVRGLLRGGRRLFVEASPHPVFALSIEETIVAELDDPGEASVLGTLRRDEGGPERFALSLAAAHVAGAALDWEALLAGSRAKPVALPTYPFQRKRYWISPSSGNGDVAAAGLEDARHPFLSAKLDDPGGEGLSFTGRISLAEHPWLADHAAFDTVLLPGTGLVELALEAGGEADCDVLDELVLEVPFILPERDALAVRVVLDAADADGRRGISIYSRPLDVDAADGAPARAWSRHASGVVRPGAWERQERVESWPAPGAEALEVDSLYERLAQRALVYGPAFQGVTAAWQRGEELFVEVSLPAERAGEAGRFNLHPALLDAAGHVSIDLALKQAEEGSLPMPFAWRDVSVRPKGGFSSLRFRCLPAGEGASLTAIDEEGEVVASVGGVVTRPIDQRGMQAGSGRHEALYGLTFSELDAGAAGPEPRLASLGDPGFDLDADRYPDLDALLEASDDRAPIPQIVLVDLRRAGGEENPVERARPALTRALALVQAWVSDERLADARLTVLTENSAATGAEADPDPAAAAVWGLLRSAGTEHPGRLAAIDVEEETDGATLLEALAAGGEEPQLAIRGRKVLAPRLSRLAISEGPGARPIQPDSTVLISGGCSGVGALVARHLVSEHGIRHLLLLSRSGRAGAGAEALAEELEEMGCEVAIEACNVSDRGRLAELLEAIPAAHPLGAVIHSAGVLADGTIDSMDAEQLERTLAPKAEGAWHLHELTRDLDLAQFVMFSSGAGILGAAAQANYAAANAFLDALAWHRRARGLPGVSLAWGAWSHQSKLGGDLDPTLLPLVLNQIRERMGAVAMTPEQGLELFDAARAQGDPLLVPLPFDAGVLRAQATAGTLPAVLRGIVRVPVRRAGAAGSLARQLAAAPEADQHELVLELVCTHAAAVLGHQSAADVEPDRTFKDLGFDSLGAVELRNRLAAASGLRLAPTIVFDYPSPVALAKFLGDTVGGAEKDAAATPRWTVPSAEPIAVVGMACRYPGGIDSPHSLWRFVASGSDAISGLPTDRGWDLERLYHPGPSKPGTFYAREGGFLTDAAEFDPGFFGISPREALSMDPQERILLETAWEALEDGGIDPHGLRGSETGVFAGVMYQDYGPAPGMSSGSASGRISYTLGLEGPAMTVDTACSSSLVAIHLATQSLRGGECSLALAGGVAVAATPSMLIFFSQQRGLAADGRCKAFADSADGTGVSEGVGIVLLERLSDARRNGHPVLATIRGSAINQDGASNGITAPNGPAQERVIRQALSSAGLTPDQVDAVEAHGTGTALGDPIEAGALIATYGQDRQRPLWLGSVKSNIGHPQAAAGVAGVIKTVMAIRERTLPPTLHVEVPSTKVDWSSGQVELLRDPLAWDANGHPRRAGVSSFGASGTNAHLILEEAPSEGAAEGGGPDSPAVGDGRASGPVLLPLSAKSEDGLAALAARLRSHLLERPELEPADVGYSLATTRAALEWRAGLVAHDRDEALRGLAALERQEPDAGLAQGRAQRGGKLAYLFSGQGSQRAGMGRELYDSYPVFAGAFDLVCERLDPHLDSPLRELVFADDERSAARLQDTANAQPAIFALQVALFRLLEQFGLRPKLLAGHSVGELTAAHLADVFDLDDAARLVAERGRLMGQLPAGGAMLAVQAEEQEVAEAIEGQEDSLSLAAINGPRSVVVSGKGDAVAAQEERWREAGRKTKRLAVSHAFHSPLIDPMLDEFERVARQVEYREPRIPLVSDLTGGLLEGEQATDPAYWIAHARQPVRFADVVATLRERGAGTFLELGPEAVLSAMAKECLREEAVDGPEEAQVAPCLRATQPEPYSLALALAHVHAGGERIEWDPLFAPAAPRRVSLPTYPFRRQRFWLESTPAGGSDPSASGQVPTGHPLLAASVPLAAGEGALLTGRVSVRTHPWLADHVLGGRVFLPGTALLELALRAGRETGAAAIEELVLQAPLFLPERGAQQLQVRVGEADPEGRREVAIHSRPEAEEGEAALAWTCHARGVLGAAAPAISDSLESWPPPGAERLEVDGLYERLASHGVEYGPAFRAVRAAWRAGGEVFVELSLGAEQADDAARFVLHPALFDAAGHVGVDLALGSDGDAGEPALPFAWRGVQVAAVGATSLRVRASGDGTRGALLACDGTGALVAAIESLVMRPLEAGALEAASGANLPMHRLEWLDELGGSPNGPAPAGIAVLGELALGHPTAERHADLASLLRAIEAGAPAPESIVAPVAASDAEAGMVDRAHGGLERTLDLLKGALADERLASARLCVLTEGGVAASEGEAPDPAQAAIWGMVRSAQAEHPGRFALLDLDGDPESLRELPAALRALNAEPQIALRKGRPLAPRLVRSAASSDRPEAVIDPEKTVLITGGTGGLGGLLAHHLVREHGARHLLLASRRGDEAAGAERLLEELERLGAEARAVACDVGKRAQVEALLAALPAERPLGAVVHAAATVKDGLLDSLDRERLRAVLAPKLDAAWHLHELTAELDLSHFVLFSSAAGVLGTPGQSNYAAANAFLDALALRRRAAGLPATSLAWGPWALETGINVGMDEADVGRLVRTGLAPLSPERGLELFDAASRRTDPALVPADFERAGLREQAAAGTLPPILSRLAGAPVQVRAKESLAERLALLPVGERRRFVLELVRDNVAAVLGHRSSTEIEPDAAFMDLGFDSLAAIELRNRLDAATGLRIQPTLVFDHPSAAAVAEYLLGEVGPLIDEDDGGAGEGRAADALSALAAMLPEVKTNDRLRDEVGARLQALLSDLADASDEEESRESEELGSMSHEEMFELIDEEFGAV